MAEKIPIEKCFQILGLELSASLEDVKEAHRFLVQTFHEDKYPVESSMRARAKEKMIELNDAYQQLKDFFEENPQGYRGKGGQGEDGGAEMDWRAWQNQQENRAGGAIEQWQLEERERRAKVKLEDERTQRKHLVNFGMIGAWLALVLMWIGHGCTGAGHQYSDASRVAFFKNALAYKIQMGTATQADMERLNQSKDRWNADAEKNNGSIIVLYVMLAVLVYASSFPKPKRCIANWIETGTLSDLGTTTERG